ncbi:DsbA family protein [Arenibacterium halophilum]|nr:DsbA family protein [Arenibacterium halophilum]
MRRRDLLIIGGLAAGALSVPKIYAALQPEFTFEPMDRPAGFRQVPFGAISGGNTPIALIGIGDAQPETPADDLTGSAACDLLFGEVPSGRVPLALFNDYYCTYCPAVSRVVQRLEDSGAPIAVTLHELPLLGQRSVEKARLALAAAQQGAHGAVHRMLMETPVPPGVPGLNRVARALSLNPDQLRADLGSADVSAKLDITRALARLFAIPGTPAMVVGRTLLVGNVTQERLEKLIEIEQADAAWPANCGKTVSSFS